MTTYNLNDMNVSVITETLKARIEYLESRIESEGEGTAEWAAPELAEACATLRLFK
ncbi:MAG: hypothetical protein BMS9Abin33_1248 [Gammaproteobacteria bacterium]|nr:MAG: hypothetical protein BMS9Abin33_1248 [Gammaproteobacteria bacterium]